MKKSLYRSLVIIADTATLLRDALVSQIFIMQAEARFQKNRQLPSKGPFTFLYKNKIDESNGMEQSTGVSRCVFETRIDWLDTSPRKKTTGCISWRCPSSTCLDVYRTDRCYRCMLTETLPHDWLVCHATKLKTRKSTEG